MAAQDPSLDWQGWLSKGEQAFKAGRYWEAADAFHRSIDLKPSAVTPHLYLGIAWVTLYIPGSTSDQNIDLGRKAEDELMYALRLEPNNVEALASIGSLMYREAEGLPDVSDRLRKLDQASSWYEKLIRAYPTDKEAYFSLGVIDWSRWYPVYMRARTDSGMKPADPGPLTNSVTRKNLREECGATVEHGIAQLTKALELDPNYSDAMAYMNLFIRERADLRDTAEEYKLDVQTADRWVEKALNAKKSESTISRVAVAPPRPPPPPRPEAPNPQVATPQRIRIGGSLQEQQLIHKVEPLYPQLAREARIQGTVRFVAIIARDGHVQNLQMVSGHPLLVESARQAVAQWVYRRTLLNGQPVEVVTTVDVTFALP